LNEKVNKLDEKVDKLEEKFDKLDEKVDKLEEKFPLEHVHGGIHMEPSETALVLLDMSNDI
jgi:predicted nuclease with TOPRIM domain